MGTGSGSARVVDVAGVRILKSDVAIAKNYLNEQHVKELNRIVSAYLVTDRPTP
jgi:hypothetical protein